MKIGGNFWLGAGDALLIAIGYFLAYNLRFDFDPPRDMLAVFRVTVFLVVALKLFIFYLFGIYRVMWRYISMVDLRAVMRANAVASVLLLVGAMVVMASGGSQSFPVMVILDGLLGFLLTGGVRAAIRLTYITLTKRGYLGPPGLVQPRRKPAVIVGAGEVGEKICREIRDNPRVPYEVIGFLDDDPKKIGLHMHGLRVLGNLDHLETLARDGDLEGVIVAINVMPGRRMRRIVEICQRHGIAPRRIPVLGDILDGHVTINRLRPVDYQDLLGREPADLQSDIVGRYLQGRRVLVTGGAGSIGSELCRQIAAFSPKCLVVCDNNENRLYEIEIELRQRFGSLDVRPALADVREKNKLLEVISRVAPQVVFHAAAYKHVPMMELHPWEAVHNNIVGTLNVLECAERVGVERFVFVSTDKAVRPTSVMGATKRIGEMLTLMFNAAGHGRWMIVRFGNVAGSEGSVIPLFRKQIERGGPVTVTHPEIERYFMTIPEASQLILQAGSMSEGGEIFVLDMGTPLKILEVARDLMRLSGLEPDRDIEIIFTGLRPGEKLSEELVAKDESVRPTAHENIVAICGQTCDRRWLLRELEGLVETANRMDAAGVRMRLRRIVPEYVPSNGGGLPE